MRFWPRSLIGQMMLAVALALLLAQGIGAMLVYRAGAERREQALIHGAAFRLLSATRDSDAGGPAARRLDRRNAREEARPRGFRIERTSTSPLTSADRRLTGAEANLRRILAEQDLAVRDIVVLRRKVADDPPSLRRLSRQIPGFGERRRHPHQVVIAGVQLPGSEDWLVARVFVLTDERENLAVLILQTLLIYAVLMGAIGVLLRRITRPLAALTGRLETFAETRSPDGQLEPQGPDDVRRLIVAHNAMEARIAALLDEKDVMLGAIGHDLKTPLAALRVRIESVEDETERARMAATIEDITRSLDDILSLARVGRPSDPREQTEISSLVASIVEEYEDMGEAVTLGDSPRIAMPLRPTWLRRALRNLIDNALRYGESAHVSLTRVDGEAVIRVDDQGPGIAEDQIAAMMEPFARGEPSRNTKTGGAGLGLTLARAIAEQHGGSLRLTNRRAPDGGVAGLTATLRLPIR